METKKMTTEERILKTIKMLETLIDSFENQGYEMKGVDEMTKSVQLEMLHMLLDQQKERLEKLN